MVTLDSVVYNVRWKTRNFQDYMQLDHHLQRRRPEAWGMSSYDHICSCLHLFCQMPADPIKHSLCSPVHFCDHIVAALCRLLYYFLKFFGCNAFKYRFRFGYGLVYCLNVTFAPIQKATFTSIHHIINNFRCIFEISSGAE